jgi:hypothetical protein
MRHSLLVITLGAALVAGCGSSTHKSAATPPPQPSQTPEHNPSGDIPDSQVYVAFHPPGASYALKVPEGWSQTSTGGLVRFTDKLNTIAMQSQSSAAATSAAQALAVDVPRLRRSVKGFRLEKVDVVARSAGKAVRIRYLAKSPPDPVTGKSKTDAVERYLFSHGGRAVILTLSGPKGADNVDPWRIVSNSLRWTR